MSPLRALAIDVDKNLRGPRRGISLAAQRLGTPFREPTIGIRTGDSTESERRRLVRDPPDILITTPESLYLMLTSQARETLIGGPDSLREEPVFFYNLGCYEARLGQRDAARAWLLRSFEMEPDLRHQAKGDPDLRDLWGDLEAALNEDETP